MGRLTDQELKGVLSVVRKTYARLDPEDFAREATRALGALVPADRYSYSEVHRDQGMVRMFVVPETPVLGGSLWDALKRHSGDNPILAYYRRTRRAQVRAFSDFMTRAQFHRLPLYNEYYRHVGVEHQVILPLDLTGSASVHEVGIALSRTRRDFTARERRVLELLQPHLTQAYTNAHAAAHGRARGAWLESALEASGMGVISVGRGEKIRYSSGRSRELLDAYFEGRARAGARLPEDVARWMRCADQSLTQEGTVPAPRRPLVARRDGKQLTVRLLGEGEERTLLLQERRERLDAAALAPLGLTPREAEVLVWLARGKSNPEIAIILGARPATVAKHLEHIYRKLGVETRLAALRQALSVSGQPD